MTDLISVFMTHFLISALLISAITGILLLAKFLLRNGADEIVYPEKQLAAWTAIRYSSDHIFDYIELAGDYAIFEIEIPFSWIGRSVGEINIRQKYNINIMALKRDNKMELTITSNTCFKKGDAMLVLGKYKDIQKCFHI